MVLNPLPNGKAFTHISVESIYSHETEMLSIATAIRGEKFIVGKTILKIDGKVVNHVKLDQSKMIFTAPKMQSEGFKTVEIINPGGRNYVLENVLLYSDGLFMDHSKTTQIEKKNSFASTSNDETTKKNPQTNLFQSSKSPPSRRVWGKPT